MRAEELMIGDWYYWEAEGKKYPMQVTKDTFKLSDEDISNFQPIPLTPEILEKNGFNDSSFEANKKYKYIIHTNEYQLGYYTKTGSFNVYKRGIDPFYTKNVFCCGFQNIVKYVHELQHALRSCGIIDKEIII